MDIESLMQLDQSHVWHPYSVIGANLPIYPVASAKGVILTLMDGKELIDGMSSWWSAIHGYNHPFINQALHQQIESMSHVMFGGLTHQPAIELAARLVSITPEPLQTVFFADSGSVCVEVAMKMAIQYWNAEGLPKKQHFISLRKGYHGDTFGAMSVCDPETGMHTLFNAALQTQHFVNSPSCRFGEACTETDIEELKTLLADHSNSIAALIMEPIVQGAGGMWFYSAEYLLQAHALCKEYGVLLILDEIATGFGRTGKLFACEHADVSPDILCVGKALTGGYLSLAATLTTEKISLSIKNGNPGVFMHGPTFMANPLACSAALASLQLLQKSDWQTKIANIEQSLKTGLAPCRDLDSVCDVRVLGAIGVVEMKEPVDMKIIQPLFVNAGVWIRPFGRLIYLMPPYIIGKDDLKTLIDSMFNVIKHLQSP